MVSASVGPAQEAANCQGATLSGGIQPIVGLSVCPQVESEVRANPGLRPNSSSLPALRPAAAEAGGPETDWKLCPAELRPSPHCKLGPGLEVAVDLSSIPTL